MSPAQHQLYFRAWASVVKAHGWRGSGDTLHLTRQLCFVSPELDVIYQAVWNTALELARVQKAANLVLEHLRHACHLAAGTPYSSKRFTNADLDRVLALFRLLANPDLRTVSTWDDPDAGERKRHLWVIRQAPPAYVSAIARDKFGTADLEALNLDQLRQLSLTVRSRQAARATVGADVRRPPAPATPPYATEHLQLTTQLAFA